MGIDNNPITEFENIMNQYPGLDYPVESAEGKAIESTLFALIEIKGLSSAEEQQRDFLANKIITNKLRNYTI